MIWQRHGRAEVELLRRCAKARAGTRVWAEFVLTQESVRESNGRKVGVYQWEYTLDVPGRSRPFNTFAISFAHAFAGLPRDTKTKVRDELVDTTGWDIYRYTLSSVMVSIETHLTPSKHPRFRVVQIDWTEPEPQSFGQAEETSP